MTQRLDSTRLFVISLALISLLAPYDGDKGYQQPLSPPILIPTKTATATPSAPTATRRPTATTAPPTSESTPTAARVEPTLQAEPTRLRSRLSSAKAAHAEGSSQAQDKAVTTPPRPTPTRAAPTSTPRPTLRPPDPTPAPPIRLRIPAINLDAPVVTVGFVNSQINGQPTTTWAVPDAFAVGWHHTSTAPGQAGNMVLNGHQNVYGGVFQNLAALQANDEIIVYAGDVAHHYRVTEQHTLKEEGQPLHVRAQNAQWIMPSEDERLTLITCAPYPKTAHRLIVVALPVRPTPPLPFEPVAQ